MTSLGFKYVLYAYDMEPSIAEGTNPDPMLAVLDQERATAGQQSQTARPLGSEIPTGLIYQPAACRLRA